MQLQNSKDTAAILFHRRRIIEGHFAHLNEMQREAVLTTEGPLLILAGAGSGKTTVLVERIVNLLTFGKAYQSDILPNQLTHIDSKMLEAIEAYNVNDEALAKLMRVQVPYPWQIMAITFTNKAAGELKERLQKRLGETGSQVAASTFHSACLRVLRSEIDKLGYKSDFVIYDTDDSLRVVKAALKQCNIDERIFPPKAALAAISASKDALESPDDMKLRALRSKDFKAEQTSRIYEIYQEKLKSSNAVDFDDIISLTVEIFECFPDVLKKYQSRYRYLLVDEYQDTNHSQHRFVSLMTRVNRNLCVVGDDDQSIYRFRGANIENILSFERLYPDAKIIRLEQNYRSTQMILSAANHVIVKNRNRKDKRLWTSSGDGDSVLLCSCKDEQDEANTISRQIELSVGSGASYSQHAVLYRVNAQSAAIETAFMSFGIPYRVIGGQRFFDRKEIKDMLAYLSVINNPRDDIRMLRIVNEPKRGIGSASVEKALEISHVLGIGLFDVLSNACEYEPLARRCNVLEAFGMIINSLSEHIDDFENIIERVLEVSGYESMLLSEGIQGQTRLENIAELKTALLNYKNQSDDPSISGFLEEVALYSDIDQYDKDDNFVTLMTLHSAKGLEFDTVYLPGMEEGICPSERCFEYQEEIEEERRLVYVGITRAKRKLVILSANRRTLYGKTRYGELSRFVRDIPEKYLSKQNYDKGDLEKSDFDFSYNGARSRKMLHGKSIGIGKTSGAGMLKNDITSGMRVKHRVFGEGTVKTSTDMGGDSLLEIVFDIVGTKKIMLNYAKLEIIGEG
jgi:DNA helicase-2/ATP-dependent DNA helicase PcrA